MDIEYVSGQAATDGVKAGIVGCFQNRCKSGERLMKRKYYFIIAAAVLMIGLLAGCGDEDDETVETATQESLYEVSKEKSKENVEQQDETADEMPDWLAAYVDYAEKLEAEDYTT